MFSRSPAQICAIPVVNWEKKYWFCGRWSTPVGRWTIFATQLVADIFAKFRTIWVLAGLNKNGGRRPALPENYERGTVLRHDSYLLGDKGPASSGGLVVEQNPVHAVHVVGLPVVDHGPESIYLGDGVRRSRVERSFFGLRDLLHFTCGGIFGEKRWTERGSRGLYDIYCHPTLIHEDPLVVGHVDHQVGESETMLVHRKRQHRNKLFLGLSGGQIPARIAPYNRLPE